MVQANHSSQSYSQKVSKASRWAALVALAIGVAACGGPEPSRVAPMSIADDGAPTVTPRNNYRLGPGDRVRVTVYGQPEMTGEYSVSSNGRVAFPLVGQIDAAGRTSADLEKSLAGRLSPQYLKDPSISIEVLNYRPFYIIGEVKQPGSYSYVSDMTVLNAVALAGGYTYRARENTFVLKRPSGSGTRDDYLATADTPVLPGDIIMVRERYF